MIARAPVVIALIGGISATACHRGQAASRQPVAAAGLPSIFTDSTLHAKQCEPAKAGEDWRTVCMPRNQGLEIAARPKKP